MFKYLTLSALALCFAILSAPLAMAQEQDAENSKDHPMFNRLPNFYIQDYSNAFNAVEFVIGEEKYKSVEGNATQITYNLDEQEGKIKGPSILQIRRNYQNAITKLGGKTLYSTDQNATFKLTKGGKEIWVMLDNFLMINTQEVDAYRLSIVEVEAMQQEITANDILAALNEKGFIALQINFETGKSAIQKESMLIVDQIAQMLKDNPTLKVSVEGHTDNVGQPAANKTLSQGRAKAVVAALTAKGIAAARLTSVGWGQEKPVADNRTEEGRAQNRRVEIVKK